MRHSLTICVRCTRSDKRKEGSYKLLTLPAELWHQIMKAAQDWEKGDEAPRITLRNAALAHRILRPYAQEEILRILCVSSGKQLIALVESLRGSRRLAEHAKQTEDIELYNLANEGGRLNELLTTLFEMCCNTKSLYFQHMDMRLSTIGKSPAIKSLN
jgi:hypothetical protein